MKFFSPDSKFAQIMTAVGEMMLLNLCWILASLPLVTVGAANAAMYTLMGRWLREEGSGTVGPFFKAFWRNLGTGIFFWLIQVFVTGSLGLFFFLPFPTFLKVIAGILLVLVTTLMGVIYPQIARFRNSRFAYFRNAVILLVLKFRWVMLHLLLILAPVLLFLLAPVGFLQWSIVWFLFGFSAMFYLSAKLMVKILQPLEEMAENRK